MKKKLGIIISSLCIYFIFVLMLIPARFVVEQITLPKDLQLLGVSGTIWHSTVQTVYYQQTAINQVDAQLNLWSLLRFDPQVDFAFGGALVKGIEGKFSLRGFFSNLSLEQGEFLIAANDIASQLSLPVPVVAHNNVSVLLEKFVVGQPVCQQISGMIVWENAAVSALNQTVDVGTLRGQISCEEGALMVSIEPKNDLGLTFSAYYHQGNKISGDGYLLPGEKFPKQLTEVLPFIGRADDKGRYKLQL